MDRFRQLEVFVAVADTGGFAKAAAALHTSPPVVTRLVSALEERLGARLLNRTTRSLSLTEAGARFLETARRLLEEVAAAEQEILAETASAQGHLTVTAPVTFGRVALAPILGDFLTAHPRMTCSAILQDRIVNLVEEGIDLGVRIGELPDSRLMARRVGQVRRLVVASPDYLARRGPPETPRDLKLHAFVAFSSLMPAQVWRYFEAGQARQVALAARLELNDAAAAIGAAEAGQGITVALSYMVAEQLRSGRLKSLLEDFAPPPLPVHLVYPQSRLLAPKLRGFLDFAAPRLEQSLRDLTAP